MFYNVSIQKIKSLFSLLGNSGVLFLLSPLGTVLESFPSYGSSVFQTLSVSGISYLYN